MLWETLSIIHLWSSLNCPRSFIFSEIFLRSWTFIYTWLWLALAKTWMSRLMIGLNFNKSSLIGLSSSFKSLKLKLIARKACKIKCAKILHHWYHHWYELWNAATLGLNVTWNLYHFNESTSRGQRRDFNVTEKCGWFDRNK